MTHGNDPRITDTEPREPAAAKFNESLFEGNLLALLRLDPVQSEHLRRLPRPGPEVAFFRTRTGDTGVMAHGRYLTSRYDPVKEARSEVEKIVKSTGTLPRTLCILGSAGGYLIREALAAGCRDIHVYDPDSEVLSATLGTNDFREEISKGHLRFSSGIEKVYFPIHYRIRMEPDLALAVSPGYLKAYPESIGAMRQRLGILVRNTDVISQTLAVKLQDWFDHSLQNIIAYVRHPTVDALADAFQGVPAVIVSAGPSLDKNIATLADYRDRALVISVGTSLRKLDRLGIVPDLAVAIESNDITNQFKDISFLPEVFTALNLNSFPGLWSLPFRGIFGFTGGAADNRWMMQCLGRENTRIAVGGSVSNTAFAIASLMGVDPVILIGQDLSYSESGELHAKGIGLQGAQDIRRETIEKIQDEEALAKEGLHFIDGYNGGKVMTKANLLNYLLWFEQSVTAITSSGRRAFNCTEGGAMIRGFIQRSLAEVLSELPPLAPEVRRRLTGLHVPKPADMEKFADLLEDAVDQADTLEKNSKKLIEKIEATLLKTSGRRRSDAMIDALRLAEKVDREVLPILAVLDPMISPLCNKAVLITETAFDYEGLDPDQQRRMNLQQTYAIYASLNKAAAYLIQSFDSLLGRLEEEGLVSV